MKINIQDILKKNNTEMVSKLLFVQGNDANVSPFKRSIVNNKYCQGSGFFLTKESFEISVRFVFTLARSQFKGEGFKGTRYLP